MTLKDIYTTIDVKEEGKIQISNDAYAIVEAISELIRKIERIGARL